MLQTVGYQYRLTVVVRLSLRQSSPPKFSICLFPRQRVTVRNNGLLQTQSGYNRIQQVVSAVDMTRKPS